MLSLSGCSVTETIGISDEISSSSEIQVADFFVDVLYDFSQFLPENDESIMDSAIESFAVQLSESGAVSTASSEKTGENQYILEFSFSDADSFLSSFGVENQSLITVTDNSFAFDLSISNYPELKSIVPFLADPNFEVYGPEYNQGMSDADYLEMISFLLGEEGPSAIENGMVEVIINVPGTITETVNAGIIDSDTVSFRFPIIRFLLLSEPISFSVSWS